MKVKINVLRKKVTLPSNSNQTMKNTVFLNTPNVMFVTIYLKTNCHSLKKTLEGL